MLKVPVSPVMRKLLRIIGIDILIAVILILCEFVEKVL